MPSYSPTPYELVAAASQTAALHSQFPRRLAHQHLKHVVIASAPVVFSTLGLTLSVTVPPQGHLVGTPVIAQHSLSSVRDNQSSLNAISCGITRYAHRCAALLRTPLPHPLPLLVNPLTTFLFDKVCVLVTPTCGFYCFNL